MMINDGRICGVIWGCGYFLFVFSEMPECLGSSYCKRGKLGIKWNCTIMYLQLWVLLK